MSPFPFTADTLQAAKRTVLNLDLLTIDLPLGECIRLPIAPGVVLSIVAETVHGTPNIQYLEWIASSADLGAPLSPMYCGPWPLDDRQSLIDFVLDSLHAFEIDLAKLTRQRRSTAKRVITCTSHRRSVPRRP